MPPSMCEALSLVLGYLSLSLLFCFSFGICFVERRNEEMRKEKGKVKVSFSMNSEEVQQLKLKGFLNHIARPQVSLPNWLWDAEL